MTATTATSAQQAPDTRAAPLLLCGAAAGVLFVAVSFAQAFTRSGFDLREHALSALTLGDLGWLQVTNFVVTGLLAGAFAIGLRRVLRPGRAATAGPILIGLYGIAMIGGGLFTPDPALGWPAGAPAGLPERQSTGSTVHVVFGAVAFMSLIVAGIVFARREAGRGHRTWATYSVANSVAAFVLTALPWSEESASLRFAVGAVLISSWLVALSCRLHKQF
ncbi:DUF998 domain-containing protein [Asanoa iriomotensis]|uniref:DUF998 domain-containing protein n=1 Tax=Asanoa iriomotensis TaxID=234613 RepID=A0ABQ4CFF3_9ACTN|nr:DUF998 domain-containing protein [Asanoa iriomotensis]GIF61507.1 hypothetical protein Air01nite_76020 [Asanoa iriomotensis]